MLVFASICPHPPLIIPTIGKPEDLKLVPNTTKSMEKISEIFHNSGAETLILISPHGPMQFDQFTINQSPSFEGNLQNFGDYETEFIYRNDRELIKIIENNCKKERIPIRLVDILELDHGSLVPLYFLSNKSKHDFKLIHLAFSFLDFKTHFNFGKIIQSVIKDNPKKIGIIASGDLSHRSTKNAPGGYSPEGKKFDEKLIKLIEKKDVEGILNLDLDFVEAAGECGLRSILILLGTLDDFDWKPEILSYEAPFGVGYMTANFKLK